MVKQIFASSAIIILYGFGITDAWSGPAIEAPRYEPRIVPRSSTLWCLREVDGQRMYVQYSHPSRNPCLDEDQKHQAMESTVKRWLGCVECTPAHLHNVVRWNNAALGALRKAYEGDEFFLGIDAESRGALRNEIDALRPHFTEPVDQEFLVEREVERKKRVARTRARQALEAIGTPEALDIL